MIAFWLGVAVVAFAALALLAACMGALLSFQWIVDAMGEDR